MTREDVVIEKKMMSRHSSLLLEGFIVATEISVS